MRDKLKYEKLSLSREQPQDRSVLIEDENSLGFIDNLLQQVKILDVYIRLSKSLLGTDICLYLMPD